MATKRSDQQTDAIDEFFARLKTDVPEFHASGSIRFDVASQSGIECWYIDVDKGHVEISHKNGPADAATYLERDVFEGLVTGRVNAYSAMMRGLLRPEGNLGLLAQFQRVFPGPPESHMEPYAATSTEGMQAKGAMS